MHELWLWFHAQSDTTRAALVTALVAIVGLTINNWVVFRKMKTELAHDQAKTAQQLAHDQAKTAQQLAHDRQQKEAQRKLDLRRDIYLGLAEHLMDGIFAISAWADLSLPHRDLVNSRRRASKYAAQVHLMAAPGLVDAVVRCNRAIDEAILNVRVMRDKALREEAKMLQLRKHIDAIRARGAAAGETLRSKGLLAPVPAEEAERLRRIAATEEQEAHRLAVQHDAILNTLSQQKYEVFNRALQLQKTVYPLAFRVVEAARAELGEQIDMSIYTKVLATELAEQEVPQLREMFGVPAGALPTNAD